MTSCLKTETELKRWLTDFQSTACKSYTGSVAFMKTLSSIAVSTVVYNREIFPKRFFTIETYEGEKIPLLKSKSNSKEANLFYSWIIGFQDALEKKYLRSIVLSFYENASKPETFIENYKFTFMYNEDNENSQLSASTVKDATVTFLKNCGLPASKFKKLPEKYEMTMKLFYYDEDTPADYEPPGFNPSPESDASLNYETMFKFRIGSVTTPCHKMVMVTTRPISPQLLEKSDDISDSEMTPDAKIDSESQTTSRLLRDTSRKTLSPASPFEVSKTGAQSTSSGASTAYDDPVSPNPFPLVQSVEDLFNENDLFNLQSANADSTANSARGDKIIENKFTKLSLNKPFDSIVSAIHGGGDIRLCCPCGNKYMGDTIQCQCCKTFQHSICYGLFDNKEPITHHCDRCASKYAQISCTDLNLFGLDPTSKKELCLFRNALVTCTSVRLTSTNKLARDLKVSTMTAVNIIQKMDGLNLFLSAGIDPTDLMQHRLINHTVLSSTVLPRFFLKYPCMPKESSDVDDDTDNDYSDATPNVLSQKEMETDNPSYARETPTSEPRSSRRIRNTTKRFSTEPVTEKKIKRKISIIDSIKSNQSNK